MHTHRLLHEIDAHGIQNVLHNQEFQKTKIL